MRNRFENIFERSSTRYEINAKACQERMTRVFDLWCSGSSLEELVNEFNTFPDQIYDVLLDRCLGELKKYGWDKHYALKAG